MNLADLEGTRDLYNRQKEEEARAEQGDQVTLNCTLPDGSTCAVRFPLGVTVAYVKFTLEQQKGLPTAQQVLKLGTATLIDPMSLADYPAIKAGAEVDIAVSLKQ